ncbi:hypothetical protein C0J52_26267 [Blattella germanica]|nr:hypothetical protein C0J52_26267 [Blattella germanica]
MYSTYILDDFWAEITKSGHIDGTLPKTLTVERLADVWLNNDIKRFPVLTITRKYDNDTALVEQHVFTKKINESLTEEEKEMLWSIPITYLTPCRLKTSAVHPVAWIHDRELTIDNLPDVDSFIIVNPTDSGMFFVNYDERNWNLLAESLIGSSSEHNIPSVSRRKLLQDALFLAAGGELSYRIALNMTTFLFKETDHSVWLPFLQQIIQLQSICYFTPVEDKLNIYIRELVGPLYVSMTQPDYETQSYDYIMFWYKARDVLQRVGYQPHIDEQNKYMKTQLPTFSYFDNDTQILNGTLDEDTAFMSYEFNNLFHLLTACPQSYNMTVDFFVENFDELRHRQDMWNGMVDAVFSKVRTRSQMDRLTALYEEKKPKFGYSSSNVKREISEAKRLTEARESSLYEIELWFDQDWPAIKDAIM